MCDHAVVWEYLMSLCREKRHMLWMKLLAAAHREECQSLGSHSLTHIIISERIPPTLASLVFPSLSDKEVSGGGGLGRPVHPPRVLVLCQSPLPVPWV
ncbi:hypothetical protein DPEC_G00291800 [Dallia pectoralis]|uniref:Uncharacterized protein n=1 Tax=Dallia pectoralis TaxID=75939 RepID=A0ACC2FHQ7_DALPE|nr:hypothetical protein DPEC_G00291800 [Dallia pectoralis]